MGDDYEHRRMIYLIFLHGVILSSFFFSHPLFFSWHLILRYLCMSLYVT